jgi:hypothetical protein
MDYWPEPGVNLVQAWYEEQEDEVRAEFDYALLALSETIDWTGVPEFRPLKGEHLGLYEIVINVQLPAEKKKRRFRPIGMWQPDSCDFIILLVCEKKGKHYEPPLSTAVDYKVAWKEHGTGEIYEHNF